jgi:hypothetical protein
MVNFRVNSCLFVYVESIGIPPSSNSFAFVHKIKSRKKKTVKTNFFSLNYLFCFVFVYSQVEDSTSTTILPTVQQQQADGALYTIDPSTFQFAISQSVSVDVDNMLLRAFDRYYQITFNWGDNVNEPTNANIEGTISTCYVTVKSPSIQVTSNSPLPFGYLYFFFFFAIYFSFSIS